MVASSRRMCRIRSGNVYNCANIFVIGGNEYFGRKQIYLFPAYCGRYIYLITAGKGLIINLCIESQEESEECETMPSVSEAAQDTVEIDSKMKKVLVSGFIILGNRQND